MGDGTILHAIGIEDYAPRVKITSIYFTDVVIMVVP